MNSKNFGHTKLAARQNIVWNSVVIGGSKPNRGAPEPTAHGLRLDWWLVGLAALVFGGATGAWFVPGELEGQLFQGLRLSFGVILLALLVGMAGSLICGRNAIRWGVGMPLAAYVSGSLMAIASHPGEALGLALGAPVFAGLTVAAGLVGTLLVDGLARNLWPRSGR